MGELTASMVRMETVKAHDEDYFMQLDQRISRDLDVDLSETIMDYPEFPPLTKQQCKWVHNCSTLLF